MSGADGTNDIVGQFGPKILFSLPSAPLNERIGNGTANVFPRFPGHDLPDGFARAFVVVGNRLLRFSIGVSLANFEHF